MIFILLLSTIVSGYCLYLVMQSTAQPDGPAASHQEVFVIAGKLDGLVKTLHQLEDQFLSSQDIQSMAEFNTVLAQLTDRGQELKAVAGNTNESKTAQIATQLVQTAQEYDASIKKRTQVWETKGLDVAAGLQAKLHSAAEKITNITPVSQPKKMADVLSELNRAQTEYFTAGNGETLNELEIASNTLQEIIKRSTVTEPEKSLLQQGIKHYISALNKYQAVSLGTDDPVLKTAFASEQEKQRGVMRSTTLDIETVINNLQVSPLEAKITLVREHEKEYLRQPTDQNVTLMHQAIGESLQEVQDTSLPAEQKEALLQALNDYRDIFSRIADLDKIIHDTVSRSAHYLAQLDSQIKLLHRQPPAATNPVDQLTAFLTRADVLPAAAAVVGLLIFGIIATVGLARSVSSLTEKRTGLKEDTPAAPEPMLSATDDSGNTNGRELPPQVFNDTCADLERTVRRLIDLSDTLPTVVTSMTEQNRALEEFLHTRAQSETEVGSRSPADQKETDRLSDISRTADNLTEELDMLALNAAIKAERAGTHGREFVLVAEELEKLATRSMESARSLTEILETIETRQDKILPHADNTEPARQDLADMNAANAQALDAIAVDTNIIIDQAREIQQSVAELCGKPDLEDIFSEDELNADEFQDDETIDAHDENSPLQTDVPENDTSVDGAKS